MLKASVLGPALAVILLAAPSAAGRPGQLDPTFGRSGTVLTAIGTRSGANAVAIQPGGGIVAVGWTGMGEPEKFAMARYSRRGVLDQGFGQGGIVTTGFGSRLAEATSLAVQPDGKIAAAGYAFDDGAFSFRVVRYTVTGSPDASFGENGIVATSFGSIAELAGAIVIQRDGRIIVGGSVGDGYRQDFALARYQTSGSLDASFGVSGKVTTQIGIGAGISALVIQPDGKIVAAGSAW